MDGERSSWPPLELPKTRWKELQGLGHKVERFLAARVACRRLIQGKENDLSTALAPWLGEHPTEALRGSGIFASALLLQPTGWAVETLMLNSEETEILLKIWNTTVPSPPSGPCAVLPLPADANDPLWYALLRLRPLREFWDRELRRNTADSLRQVLPDAWLLDPTPLPAGAVIPRLEISNWRALTTETVAAHRLALVRNCADVECAMPLISYEQDLAGPLGTPDTSRAVIVEETSNQDHSPQTRWIAFYEKKDDRVDALGVLALEPNSAGEFHARPATFA